MAKPRNASYFRNPEAPKPQSPSSPVDRTEEKSKGRLRTGAGKPKPAESRALQPPATRAARPSAPSPTQPRPAQSSPTQPKSRAENSFPGAMINRRAADRLRDGYLWVYASDIESLNVPQTDLPPSLLLVADSRGLLLGTALYSPASQIALRMVSREALDEAAWLELFASRLRISINRRKRLLNESTNACRLCFSEADRLPGLVADKYGELVILQLLAKGLDSAAVRAACTRVLCEELSPSAILERPDPRIRELEGLRAPDLEPLYCAPGTVEPTITRFLVNGLEFQFDANAGQKTGAFLDQRDNYARARSWSEALGATGRALDVCTYQGGFALHLGQVCQRVTGIDASHASLEVAERNLTANRARISAEVDWVEGDAFQILRDWADAGERFDTIVLDPPAFAKTRRAVEGALRGYKELNLRALKMLRTGGLLLTCSCSHHVGWAELEATVASAAVDANRSARLLERRGAAIDHPVVLNLPETEYLKCLILEVG
jgi:23S rRNA (cytosine1962-C5)-methyltransferase